MKLISGELYSPIIWLVTALGSVPIYAGNVSATGLVLGGDGSTALPGTGLVDLVTADPALPYGYV